MPLIFTLLAGAVVTLLAEALALVTSPYSTMTGPALALGLAFIAIGIWSLRALVGPDRIGRAGLVLGSFGYAAFATISLLAMSAGISSDIAIALTPFYLMAILFMVLGLGALAAFFWRLSPPVSGLGGIQFAFAVLAVLYLLRPILADWAVLHHLATALGALTLGWIALVRVLRAR